MTYKSKAEEWAVDRLLHPPEAAPVRSTAPLFKDWAAPWWLFDSCPYIAEKEANGYSISPGYVEVRGSYLVRHLMPRFGEIPIDKLTPRHFRDYEMELYRKGELSPATINRILGTVRVMFNYAVEMGEMESNPIAPVKELRETPVARGILSFPELRLLSVLAR